MPDGKIPQSGLGILVDEKRVNELITQRTGAKAMIKAGITLLLFITFLSLFTFLALCEPRSDFYAFEGFVRRRFDTQAAMPLREVESAQKFWEYLRRSFIPGLYGNDTDHYFYPNFVPDRFLPIEDANRLLGVARLRMLKVRRNENCKVASKLQELFPSCYGPFSPGLLDDTNFGPPNMLTGDSVFPFYGLNGPNTAGKIASYPASGFMTAFTAHYNDTLNSVSLMYDNNFVGPATRVVFLDWTIYNFNTGYYAVCRILFEVAPSGKWATTFDVDILMTRHLDAIAAIFLDGDFLPLVGQIMLMLFVLGYSLEEMSEFVGFRSGRPYIKWEYFGDPWNLLDWLNLILIVLTFTQMVNTWSAASGVKFYTGDPTQAGLLTFTDLSTTAAGVRATTRIMAFNTVLVWVKAVKYISILPYITTFMETVTMTQRAIGSFTAIFCTALFGFVLAFSVAFGEQISTLRTPWNSFVFLMRSFLGNADMTVVLEASPFLASVLIFMFVLSMVFVILNVFFSIMICALADAKAAEEKSGTGWVAMVERATDLWNSMNNELRLEYRFRTGLPGLYSRINNYKKAVAEKEQERDDAVLRKKRLIKPDVTLALGPGDPSCGRRAQRNANTVNVEDFSDSDQWSEPDLGPLYKREQLTGKMYSDPVLGGEPERAAALMNSSESSGVFLPQDGAGEEDLTEDGIKLVIKATRHIVDGIVDRTHGARGVLFGEMLESKDVLLKVSSVLEVLARRSRDLEAQQENLLSLF